VEANSPRWQRVTPSNFAWEEEAIEFLRGQISDVDPNRAWSNFEFVSGGAISEVDVFLLTRKGAFLIEIKSTPGRLVADQQRWTFHRPDGGRSTMENPLLGANRKARRLKSLLEAKWNAVKTESTTRQPPFIQPLVFLSDHELQINVLPAELASKVCLRDGSAAAERAKDCPGIVSTVSQIGKAEADDPRFRQLNTPTTTAIAKALEAIGIKESNHTRRVGHWVLELDTVSERPGIQDFVADHESQPGVQRRIRIYTRQPGMSDEQAAALRRAADREFLATERFAFPSVARALERFDTDLGSAVVFDYDAQAHRLDHWRSSEDVSLDDELSVLRQIAETMQAMHRKKLTHRALSPGSILVRRGRTDEPQWVARITDLSLAAHTPSETTRSRAASTFHLPTAVPGDVALLADEAALLYQAPETRTDDKPDGVSLDVFSFGAIAYFVLAGRPPGDSDDAVRQQLLTAKGLALGAAVPGVAESLQYLVSETTRPLVSDRAASFDDVLALLDAAEEELTAPTRPTVEPEFAEPKGVDPLDAKVGDALEDGAIVKARLGRGATALALLVDLGESESPREVVYKVALSTETHTRLRDEGRILEALRHQYIVAYYALKEISGRLVLVEALAGRQSLAEELRKRGTPGVEFLQRWGDDLLDVVRCLEDRGRAHRDIKPDNLGVTEIGPNREQHLVLFDFSLSTVPATDLRAGTPPYLDPFLNEREPKQWDVAAERYAAAVTLYEMATGELPRWGDGQSDPAFTTGPAQLDGLLFDPAVRDGLTQFFATAFERDPARRHGDAEEMLRSWRRVFDALEHAPRVSSDDGGDHGPERGRVALPEPLSLDDPIVSLHAAPTVLSALHRLQVSTVRELAALVPIEVNRARRISPRVRRRIVELRGAILKRFADDLADAKSTSITPKDASSEASEAPRLDLDALVPLLLPAAAKRGRQGSTQPAVRMLLGLDPVPGAGDADWPTQTATAEALGLTRGRLGQIGPQARHDWAQLAPVQSVRDELAEMLTAGGGVMGVLELEPLLVESRGSGLDAGDALLAARAAIRAALGAEEYEAQEHGRVGRFVVRRRGDRVVVGLNVGTDDDDELLTGDAFAAYAIALGDRADAVVDSVADVVPQDRAIAELRTVEPPEGLALADGRLLRLAATASQRAGLSTRLELYPRRLDPQRAVRLARSNLASARELSEADVRERVAARFPLVELPHRPTLDGVLRAADLTHVWNDETKRYEAPASVVQLTSITGTLARESTRHVPRPSRPREVDPAVVAAQETEDRLAKKLQTGGFLALRVPTAQRRALRRELMRFTSGPSAMKNLDLEAEFLVALHALAEAKKVQWPVLVRADSAEPGTNDYTNLRILTHQAAAVVEQRVRDVGGDVILWNAGVLARYAELGVIDRLRELAGSFDTPVHTLWLVVFGSTAEPTPMIDGHPVPVIGRTQWLDIPDAWLENRHRSERASGLGGGVGD
jgi:serine/threonine protein kinase